MARRSALPDTDLLSLTSERTWRVAGTRLSLDSVIRTFRDGATPEQICQDFPSSLPLAQAYSVIGFYLANRAAIDAYLRRQDSDERALRRQLRSRHRSLLADLRRRLQQRRRAGSGAA